MIKKFDVSDRVDKVLRLINISDVFGKCKVAIEKLMQQTSVVVKVNLGVQIGI